MIKKEWNDKIEENKKEQKSKVIKIEKYNFFNFSHIKMFYTNYNY